MDKSLKAAAEFLLPVGKHPTSRNNGFTTLLRKNQLDGKEMTPELLELEKQADALRGEGKYEEAIAKLQEALAADEKFVRAHMGPSVLFHHTEDFAKSVYHACLLYTSPSPRDRG